MSEIVPLFSQLVSATQHCHEHSVAHLDLKLENVLVVDVRRRRTRSPAMPPHASSARARSPTDTRPGAALAHPSCTFHATPHQGRVVLIDFGLARCFPLPTPLRERNPPGSPTYIAPVRRRNTAAPPPQPADSCFAATPPPQLSRK